MSMTPEERYLRDPDFHGLVDMLEAAIRHAQYTPTEVREAAMLAAIHHDYKIIRPLSIEGWRKV